MAGEILREKREELGLGIREIADSLKIGEDYLAAIEADDFEKLPVPVYTMGYIRCYARHLGVDPQPVIEYYTKRLSHPRAATIVPVAFSRKKRSVWVYALTILVVGCISVLLLSYGQREQPKTSASTPPAAVSPVNNPPAVVAQEQTPPAENKEDALQPQPQMHRLRLNAESRTWIKIEFPGQGKTEEVMLMPGMEKSWEFPGDAVLRLGNAGGVKVSFDGTDLGLLGNSGEVLTLSLPRNKEQ